MSQVYYVTKYALTRGILKVKGEAEDGRLSYEDRGGHNGRSTAHSNEFFPTLEEARANAEERRRNRIRGLQRQIEKLKDMAIGVEK